MSTTCPICTEPVSAKGENRVQIDGRWAHRKCAEAEAGLNPWANLFGGGPIATRQTQTAYALGREAGHTLTYEADPTRKSGRQWRCSCGMTGGREEHRQGGAGAMKADGRRHLRDAWVNRPS